MNGVLSGSGNFTKAGTGKMVLTGDSSGYAGTTDIDAGTLIVNGPDGHLCGHVNVNAGARLEGTGMVCDTTNFAGGPAQGPLRIGLSSFGRLAVQPS